MEPNEPHKNDADLRALFQSKFENVEQVAPEQAWPALEKKLFQKNRFRFYLFSTTGLILLSTFIGMNWQNTNKNSVNTNAAKKSIIHSENTKYTHQNQLKKTPSKNKLNTSDETENQQRTTINKLMINRKIEKTIQSDKTIVNSGMNPGSNQFVYTSIDSNLPIKDISNKQEVETSSLLYLKTFPLMQITCSPAYSEQAQRKVLNTKKKQLYYAGVIIGAGIRLQEINGNFNSNHPNTKDLVDRTIPMRNKQIGIETGYQFNQHFALETGITFNRYTFESNWFKKEIEDKTDSESYEFSTNDGNLKIAAVELNDYFQTTNYTLLNVKVNHTSSSWLIPLTIRYDFSANRFHPFFKLGVSLERIFSNTSILEVEKDGDARNFTFKGNEIIRKNTFSTQIGIGGAYVINSSWRFNAELNYYRAFTKIVETSKMSINTNNLQLKIGFHYIF